MPEFERGTSGDSDERETPPELFKVINRLVGPLMLDVCATQRNSKCGAWYSLEDGKDGLIEPWNAPWWCNPPYSQIIKWATVAVDAPHRGAMLVPAAPETEWWNLLWTHATEVGFLRPRVVFLKDGKPIVSKKTRKPQTPKFGSALFIMGPRLLLRGGPRAGQMLWRVS